MAIKIKGLAVIDDNRNLPTANVITATSATLSQALTVPNGGTGATTLSGFVKGNGASAFTASATVNLASEVSGDLPFANLTQGDALSVLGVTGNAGADVASISAGTDHQVLRRSGTALSFGSIALNQSAAVTGTLAVGNGGSGATTLTGVLKGNGASAFTAGTVDLASEITGTLPLGNGGTGQTTAQAAINSLAGATTSGQYLRGNGTNVVMSAIQAGDVPTLNQNTTGSAATFTSTSQNSQFNSVGVGTAASATTGEIRATNNVTAYYSSDKKLKENIRNIDGALDKVAAIGGKYFDWTDEYIAQHGGEDGYFVNKSDFGVIAQDVQSVFPVAVRTREDGTLAVDYEKLCSLAFAAIVELKAEIEALKRSN